MEFPLVSRKKYNEVVYKLECLLCHSTGSKLSKHSDPLITMENAVTDYVQARIEEAVEAVESELKPALVWEIFEDIKSIWEKGRGFIKYTDLVDLERVYGNGLLRCNNITVPERVIQMKKRIELLAVQYGLNLTVYDGKIVFVDQEQKKIVALWTPEYTLHILC